RVALGTTAQREGAGDQPAPHDQDRQHQEDHGGQGHRPAPFRSAPAWAAGGGSGGQAVKSSGERRHGTRASTIAADTTNAMVPHPATTRYQAGSPSYPSTISTMMRCTSM